MSHVQGVTVELYNIRYTAFGSETNEGSPTPLLETLASVCYIIMGFPTANKNTPINAVGIIIFDLKTDFPWRVFVVAVPITTSHFSICTRSSLILIKSVTGTGTHTPPTVQHPIKAESTTGGRDGRCVVSYRRRRRNNNVIHSDVRQTIDLGLGRGFRTRSGPRKSEVSGRGHDDALMILCSIVVTIVTTADVFFTQVYPFV